jgi:hypothetical protein
MKKKFFARGCQRAITRGVNWIWNDSRQHCYPWAVAEARKNDNPVATTAHRCTAP